MEGGQSSGGLWRDGWSRWMVMSFSWVSVSGWATTELIRSWFDCEGDRKIVGIIYSMRLLLMDVDTEKIEACLCSNIDFELNLHYDRSQTREVSAWNSWRALSPIYNGFWIVWLDSRIEKYEDSMKWDYGTPRGWPHQWINCHFQLIPSHGKSIGDTINEPTGG